jgi:hypothetical protein
MSRNVGAALVVYLIFASSVAAQFPGQAHRTSVLEAPSGVGTPPWNPHHVGQGADFLRQPDLNGPGYLSRTGQALIPIMVVIALIGTVAWKIRSAGPSEV